MPNKLPQAAPLSCPLISILVCEALVLDSSRRRDQHAVVTISSTPLLKRSRFGAQVLEHASMPAQERLMATCQYCSSSCPICRIAKREVDATYANSVAIIPLVRCLEYLVLVDDMCWARYNALLLGRNNHAWQSREAVDSYARMLLTALRATCLLHPVPYSC